MTLADKIVVMRAGRIEQVGAPLELYNKPANQFVAGFIGSPAMNFVETDIVGLPKVACVGLRPEHLQIAERGRLKGEVLHYERLGTDTHVILDMGHGKLLTVRAVGQHEFTLGTSIELDFDNKNALLFDAAGKRIHEEAPDLINAQSDESKDTQSNSEQVR
jgi:multiple sugar transport system ATP-binding protein